MRSAERIEVLHIYPEIEARLVALLRSLPPEDWERPTVARLWRVKDVAAHLLDTHLRKLSIGRDGYFGEQPGEIGGYADLVAFLNRLNADWVQAARRLSPKLLTDLIELTSREVMDYYHTLDLEAKAAFPVSWAGEAESQNWFDLAREYTERWHHQMQIRLAVGEPGDLMTPRFYLPLLETFMRALPHVYRDVAAAPGASVGVEVRGETSAGWLLRRAGDQWLLEAMPQAASTPTASVMIPAELAWQVFTKALLRDEARKRVTMRGDEALGAKVLEMVSVMA
jgi:uncharacterized protein (TIGR03083 family)